MKITLGSNIVVLHIICMALGKVIISLMKTCRVETKESVALEVAKNDITLNIVVLKSEIIIIATCDVKNTQQQKYKKT